MNLQEICQGVEESCFVMEEFKGLGDVILKATTQDSPKLAGMWENVPLSNVIPIFSTWACDIITRPRLEDGTPIDWDWDNFARDDFLPVGNTKFDPTHGCFPHEVNDVFVDAYVIFDQEYRTDLLSLTTV